MRFLETGFEFRMELNTDEIIIVFVFHRFHDVFVKRSSGKHHAVFFEYLPIFVVELIAMAVSFLDVLFLIELSDQRSLFESAVIGTKSQSSAFISIIALIRKEIDDFVFTLRIKFS